MRVAIFGDIHGNLHDLEAILEDIEKEKADQIICLGDLISPFPGSAKAWQIIQDRKIPMLRGNHEDYIVDAHLGAEDSLAKLFSSHTIKQIQALPLSTTLTAPNGSQAFICHASPYNNAKSIASEIDATMAKALHSVSATTIIAGHLHKQWHQTWEGKQLYLIGSGGLPLQGNPDVVEYSLLQFDAEQWQITNKKVRYDDQSAIQCVLQSAFMEETGAFGWLYLLELITQQHHFLPMFRTSKLDPWPDEEDVKTWEDVVVGYIKRVGLWSKLQKHLAPYYL